MRTPGIQTSRSLPWARLTVLAAALLLSGCASFLGGGSEAPSDIFDLSAPTTFDERGRSQSQLLVPPASTIGALATSRIAVRPDPARIAYYPGAVWSDELPQLVQIKLIRSFENSGRARAVGRPGESLAIDYQVIVDIRAFEIDFVSGMAHVELSVKLLDDGDGRVRATRIITARVPTAANTAAEAVAALDQASDQALAEVVTWTVSTL